MAGEVSRCCDQNNWQLSLPTHRT